MADLFDKLEYTIEVGVIAGESKKRDKSKGITNAELMYIHENGSPLRNIPARPVLQMTVDYVSTNTLDKIVDKAIEQYLKDGQPALETSLKKDCVRIENYAQAIIYDNDGRLQANAPSTIKRKGFDHPLFVTGQLARSIKCILVDKKGDKV